jgi:ferredoxin
MKIESLKLVYFSPTGTTKKIIEGIARGINHDYVEHVDITKPENRKQQLETSEDGLLIVGLPVYFGRVQANAIEWLNTIKGHDTLTVCIVVYGNREYDDALLELKETIVNNGCKPIACGAYIGEHSFSSSETPIAAGRPDSADLLHAQSFGKEIRKKIISLPSIGQISDISVPGQYPYIDMGDSKKILSGVDLVSVDSNCVQCGECAQLCPVGAINFEHSASVDQSKCILCHACIKHCPTSARRIKNDVVKNIAIRLSSALQGRKEPVLFL